MEIDGLLQRSMNLYSLREVRIEFGRGEIAMLELIDAWAGRVLKLYFDMTDNLSSNARDAWTIHDLIGSLYIRDAVSRGVAGVADGRAGKVPALTAIDELYKQMTTADSRQIIRLIEPNAPLDHWWWNRLPTAGPIAEEAIEIVKRISD